MRQTPVNHNQGTKSVAKARWEAEQKVATARRVRAEMAAAIRAEFRANQNRLAMERVHQAAA